MSVNWNSLILILKTVYDYLGYLLEYVGNINLIILLEIVKNMILFLKIHLDLIFV